MARPEVTGRKLRVSADLAKRPTGPRLPDPKAIEPTRHDEPVAYSLGQAPPIRGPPPALAYSVSEFCQAARISLRLFFKLRSADCGPKETRIGRRVLITLEAASEWLRDEARHRKFREAATAQASRRATLSE